MPPYSRSWERGGVGHPKGEGHQDEFDEGQRCLHVQERFPAGEHRPDGENARKTISKWTHRRGSYD